MGRHIRLENLSGWAREQVERKLAAERGASGSPVPQDAGRGGTAAGGGAQKRGTGERGMPRRGPNRTEAEYNRAFLGGRGVYEAVTLRLPGGSRYTPDWMTTEGGRVVFHEVKGAWRHGSHNRAQVAFRECAAAFPCFGWVWAAKRKEGGWEVRNA